VDASQPEQVWAAASTLIERARAGQGAGFIVANCYRFYGHARKDKSPYRDPAEEAEGRKRDPILNQKDLLMGEGLLTEAEYEALWQAANLEMDAAETFARQSQWPDLPTMFEDVYDPSSPQPTPVEERLNRVLGGAL
jgi:pyruvate dehydrogenase E1 component alpha subunit